MLHRPAGKLRTVGWDQNMPIHAVSPIAPRAATSAASHPRLRFMYFNTVVTDIIQTVFFRLDSRQLIYDRTRSNPRSAANGGAPHALTPAPAGLHYRVFRGELRSRS